MPATTIIKQHRNGNRPERRHGSSERTNNDIERQRVADIQRARMLAAMTEVACERGAANVTVAHVVERAGVSRRTFYEIFSDGEDCLLASVEAALTRLSEQVLAAHRHDGRWRERMRASLAALLEFLDDEPHMGRLLIVETLAGGRRSLERRREMLGPVTAAVDEGRMEAKARAGPPSLVAEGLVGAVLSVLHARILEAERRPVKELLNPLMSMIVLPYLGSAAARRELARPVKSRRPPARRTEEGSPLRALDIRLTYRTVRVLSALAEHPASSNRQIAQASDIADQGQISKLLARLEKLGLIENRSTGSAARGEPNAWTLTPNGADVYDALPAQGAHA